MFTRLARARAIGLGVALVVILEPCLGLAGQRRADWDWDGNYRRLPQLNPETYVTVRTTETIESDRVDGRIFPGIVAEDVWDDYQRLVVPAIPRGSRVDLLVRTAHDGDLILDLESVYAHGRRYGVSAMPARIESDRVGRRDEDTAAWLAGSAIVGTIIGSIAGGGKGAAIGAGIGAAAGLGLAFRGESIRVPAGSRLTFRVDRVLEIGPPDYGRGRR